jgi:hypothetical protein
MAPMSKPQCEQIEYVAQARADGRTTEFEFPCQSCLLLPYLRCNIPSIGNLRELLILAR